MAIANLHETVLAYKLRRNQINLELTQLSAQKSLATYSTADIESLKSAEKHAARDYFKNLFENDAELQAEYTDYTEIPDFEEEIDKITAKFQDQLDEMTAWETALDAQITTDSAELEEVNAWLESYKTMLSSNISEDFDFGLNG